MRRGPAFVIAAVVAACVALLIVATQVPMLPLDGRLVPLDTFLAPQFPALRDFYRQRLARAFEPSHAPLLLIFVGVAAAAAVTFRTTLGTWLARLVPPVSERGLAAFRVALALGMIGALLLMTPPGAVPLDLQRSADWLGRQSYIRDVAADERSGALLRGIAIAGLAAFGAGFLPRLSLACASLGLTLLLGVLLTRQSVHDWGMPTLTLWLLTLVPWHGATSDRERGLAIWLPGLTLGAAFLAAAFAKLDTSGLAWITNGSVRFHFIEDARQAPTTWGIWLTNNDARAMAMSLGAVVVEAGFWLVLFVRGATGRALFGLAALALLGGFSLFQGVFWPAWWVLLLAFLPWGKIGHPVPGEAGPSLAWPVRAAVVGVVLLQLAVSALRVESEPFFSDYSMYAYTWSSKDAFVEHLRGKTRRYEFVSETVDSGQLDSRIRAIPRGVDTMRVAAESAARGEEWSSDLKSAVAAFRSDYHNRFGEELTRVRMVTVEREFDWSRGEFIEPPQRRAVGELDLASGHLQ